METEDYRLAMLDRAKAIIETPYSLGKLFEWKQALV
jgi:hypothetical protein